MANSEAPIRYFRRKFAEWEHAEGSAANHIRRVGRQGLAQEFGLDPAFSEVCQYVKIAGKAELRNSTYRNAQELLGDLFGIPLVPVIEILLAAVADACGYKTEAQESAEAAVKVLVTIAAVAVIGGILAALFSKD
jgi:hypothetical protein